MSTKIADLFLQAKVADDRFQAALQTAYDRDAGDMRYQKSLQLPHIQALGDDYRKAIDKWRAELRKYEPEDISHA